MKAKNQLNQLLFDNSEYEEENSAIQHQSDSHGHKLNGLISQDGDELLAGGGIGPYQEEEIQHQWSESQNFRNHFPQVGGNSIEFSQNSLMMSKRYDEESMKSFEESRNYRNHKELLEKKAKQQEKVNEVIEEEINQLLNKINTKDLEIQKKDRCIKGLNIKNEQKEKEIEGLQEEIKKLQDKIKKKQKQQTNLYYQIEKKDKTFAQYKSQFDEVINCLNQNQAKIVQLTQTNHELVTEIQTLHRNLAAYTGEDINSVDFENSIHRERVPLNEKELYNDKAVQKLKLQKDRIEEELLTLKEQWQLKEKELKNSESQLRKKFNSKETKLISQYQQQIRNIMEENKKNRNQMEENHYLIKQNVTTMNKELQERTDKIMESERRLNNYNEEFRKKQEKIKELSLQLVQKSKLIQQYKKQMEENRIKEEFNHHCLKEKQQQINHLEFMNKQLKNEKSNIQTILNEKSDKNKTNQMKLKKQHMDTEKLKKQLEIHSKQIENLQQSKEILTREKKDLKSLVQQYKNKYDDISKKLKMLKEDYHQKLQTKQDELKTKGLQNDSNKREKRQMAELKSILKKREDQIQLLKNKLKITESQLSKALQPQDQSIQNEESLDIKQKIQALQIMVSERDKQIKQLSTKPSYNSHQQAHYMSQLDQLEAELADKQQYEKKLQEALLEKQDELTQLQEIIQKKQSDLLFKERTLDFMHNKFTELMQENMELKSEKQELESRLQDSFYEQYSVDRQQDREKQFLLEKVSSLEGTLKKYRHKLQEKQQQIRQLDNSKYEIRILKERVKQLKQLALTKDKRITPQSLSKQDSIQFLIKMLRRIEKSQEMIKLLSKVYEIRSLMEHILNRLF